MLKINEASSEKRKDFRVAIASGKGGTGKTTLAVNLSLLCAEKCKVRLVDLDVEEPNSGLFLSLPTLDEKIVERAVPSWDKEKCFFCGNCQEVCNFNSIIQTKAVVMVFEQLCHSCRACWELCPSGALQAKSYQVGKISFYREGNLEFIEGRLDVGQEQAVPVIADVFSHLDKNPFEQGLTIIDSPPGIACPTVETFGSVDCILLVVEPTPFGIYDASLTVDVARNLNKPVAVVVNKYAGEDDLLGKFVADKSVEIIAKFPLDKKVAEIYSQGLPIYAVNREITEGFSQVLDYLTTMMERARL